MEDSASRDSGLYPVLAQFKAGSRKNHQNPSKNTFGNGEKWLVFKDFAT